MKVLILLALVSALPAWPQRVRDPNANSWWIYTGDHPLKGAWSFYADEQFRRADFAAIEQQVLLRHGLAYRFSPNVQVTGGYAYIHTARYGDYPVGRAFGEHRLFQQLTLKQNFKRVDFEHRYRNEQRWLQNHTGRGDDFFWRYQNRVRYQLRVTAALNRSWYMFGGDEIFLPYGSNFGAVPFDQNRAFAGVGYKLTPRNSVELGYLNQFLIQRSGRVEESNHIFRVQFSSSVPLLRTR